ncbi:hypothetical protein SMC26_42595 [Actinomadura fulvescens]
MKVRYLASGGIATVVAAGTLAGGIALSAQDSQPGTTRVAASVQDASTAAPNRYTIIQTFAAGGAGRKLRKVPLRRGYFKRSEPAKGFGFAKIALKHGFTKYSHIAKMTKVASWRHTTGTNYNLSITAREFTCGKSGCRIKRKQVVRQVVDTRITRGKPFGLVTMYCPGTGDRCPSWVMKTFSCPKIEKGLPCKAHGAGTKAALLGTTTRFDLVPGRV